MTKSSVIAEEFRAIQQALEALEPLGQDRRKFAVAMILARLGMGDVPTDRLGSLGGRTASTPTINKTTENVAIKEFIKAKAPRTDLERLTCLAYYLTHERGVEAFTTRDITKLNEDAKGSPLANASATANNAVSQNKYLSPAGHGKRRMTILGEDFVEALPDREKVKEVLQGRPARGGGRKGKRTARRK
jgi:hypothetical protein